MDEFKLTFDVLVKFCEDKQAFNAMQEALSVASDAFNGGKPYPEEYEWLEDIDGDKLPFVSLDKELRLASVEAESLKNILILLKWLSVSHEGAAFEGAMYSNTIPLLGKKVVYFLRVQPGKEKTLDIEEYGCPINNEDDFDIEEEIRAWFSGQNPQRQENADANAEDDSEQEPNGPDLDFPAMYLTLLSGNWVFFADNDIAWDGSHHEIRGIQVNAAQADQFMAFWDHYISGFEDINEVVQYFIASLREIEKDEGLIVPREKIAPGICKALPEGPMTGITLANLAACAAAFQITKVVGSAYTVLYDGRLALGIPCFFDLIGRLLWDLRQGMHSLQEKPFKVVFLQTRNFDADQCLGNVDHPVQGAQNNPDVLEVNQCPAIVLPDGTTQPENDISSIGSRSLKEEQERSSKTIDPEPSPSKNDIPKKEATKAVETKPVHTAANERARNNSPAKKPESKKEKYEELARHYREEHVRKTSCLTGDSRAIFNAVKQSGGGVDLEEAIKIAQISFDLFRVYNNVVTPLMRDGLLRESIENAAGQDSKTNCKRFYTWEQTKFSCMSQADKDEFASWAQKELRKLRYEDQKEELAKEAAQLESELAACSMFDFAKKKELKFMISGVRVRLARLEKQIAEKETLIKVLERNLSWVQS